MRRSTFALRIRTELAVGFGRKDPGQARHLAHHLWWTLLDEADRCVLAIGEEVGDVDQMLHGVAHEERDNEDAGGEGDPEQREAGADGVVGNIPEHHHRRLRNELANPGCGPEHAAEDWGRRRLHGNGGGSRTISRTARVAPSTAAPC